MNITFILTDSSLQDNLIFYAAGISGLKGHRSVGGYRAIYNLPIESVEVLINIMRNLEIIKND